MTKAYRGKTYSNDPRIQKFFEKHGPFVRYDKDWLVFRDGWRITNNADGYGDPVEPTGKHDRAKQRVKYFEIRYDTAKERFKRFKEELLGRCKHGVVTNEEDDIAELKRLRDKAHKARNRLEKALQRVEDTIPKEITHLRKHKADMAYRQGQMAGTVKDIKL